MKLLALFSRSGLACVPTIVLIFPGTMLDPLWRLNPEARCVSVALGCRFY
jgi:hypothetical protein